MKKTFAFACTSVLALTALSATADTPADGSHGHDSDVSVLADQLVPVGEQYGYRYSYPRINLSTNPLGMVFGYYGVSGSYALGANVAVRGDVSYYNEVGGDEEGFELGVGAPIYFSKVYSGLFLEPGIIVRRSTVETSAFTADGIEPTSNSATILGPQVLLGWHWMWDSGFNFAVAAGLGRNFNAEEDPEDLFPNDDEIFGNAYLRVGYAF